MVKYSFSVDDKNKTMQILLQDEMVEVANRLGLVLTVSYKELGKYKMIKDKKTYEIKLKTEKKQRTKESIKDWKHKIR